VKIVEERKRIVDAKSRIYAPHAPLNDGEVVEGIQM
jgi:hypothetical protein